MERQRKQTSAQCPVLPKHFSRRPEEGSSNREEIPAASAPAAKTDCAATDTSHSVHLCYVLVHVHAARFHVFVFTVCLILGTLAPEIKKYSISPQHATSKREQKHKTSRNHELGIWPSRRHRPLLSLLGGVQGVPGAYICGVVLAPLWLWGRRRLRIDDQYDGRPSDLRRCHA